MAANFGGSLDALMAAQKQVTHYGEADLASKQVLDAVMAPSLKAETLTSVVPEEAIATAALEQQVAMRTFLGEDDLSDASVTSKKSKAKLTLAA